MREATVFKSNKMQAVRLPKDLAFPKSVSKGAILREGQKRVLVPAGLSWDDFFAASGIVLGARDEPAAQGRGVL